MQFSNSTNKSGLIEDVDFLCGTDSTSYPLADKTRNLNQEYHNTTRLIWENTDTWQYDDSNKTDLPIAINTLGQNQQDYSLPSTARKINRVEVLDVNGNYVKLKQIDYKDIGVAMTEYMDIAGMPVVYDLVANSLFLYPAPSSAQCTLTSGLKVYFDRDITEFTTASTTASPGFATQFHRIISLQAAIDFIDDKDKITRLMVEKSTLIDGLKKFYGSRNVERRTEIRPANKKHFRQYE